MLPPGDVSRADEIQSKCDGSPCCQSGCGRETCRCLLLLGFYLRYMQGVAITQENSLLDNTARIERCIAKFPMFDWVGGRTSVMSSIGLLPAALQGIDIKEMLAGASLMDEAIRTTVVRNNPAALLALCWYWASDGVGSKDMVVLPYKDSLLFFIRYLQQLVMESIGKEFNLDGNRVWKQGKKQQEKY